MSRAIAERRTPMPDASLAVGHADDASPARPLNEYLTTDLKQELLQRGLTDFSRWELALKLSPFVLLFIAATLWKLGQDNPGSILACLTGW
jgi:hypothetical protein